MTAKCDSLQAVLTSRDANILSLERRRKGGPPGYDRCNNMLFVISFFIQMQAAQIGNLIAVIFVKWKGGPLSRLKISYVVKSYSIRERDGDHIVIFEGVCDVKVTGKLGYGCNR